MNANGAKRSLQKTANSLTKSNGKSYAVEMLEREADNMSADNFPPPPPKYANMPNLWRVFCVLSSCKNPCAVHNAFLAIAGSVLKKTGHDEQ